MRASLVTSLHFAFTLAACGGPAAPPATQPGPAAQHADHAGHADHAAPGDPTAATADGWTTYGAGVTGPVVTLEEMLAKAPQYEGQSVAASGRVSEVCQKAGCWMVLSDQARHVRIRMKDHSFAVDKAGAGREAHVMGTLISKPINPAEVAHYASETRDGGVVPENAALDGKTWEIEAVGVRMKSL